MHVGCRPRPIGAPSLAILVASLAGVGLAADPCAAEAMFTGVGDLAGGAFWSRAHAVSDDGSTVVGGSDSGHPSIFGQEEAFVWTPGGGIVGLGDIPGGDLHSDAQDVSSDGSVVVGAGWPPGLFNVPMRWTSALGMVGLSEPIGFAHAVSGDGSIAVGVHGTNVFGPTHAFRWTAAEGMVLLGSLPGGLSAIAYAVSADGSTIVGLSTSSSGNRAFRWTSSTGMVSLGALAGESDARGVSANGSTVVGITGNPAGSGRQAFVWTSAGGMVGLGDLPGGAFMSEARGISGDGETVVGVGTSASGAEAMLWDAANGMRSLRNVLTDLGVGVSGWTLASAEGVSGDGNVIVGTGTNPTGDTEGWVAVLGAPAPPQIPALAPIALLVSAAAIAAATHRRLRRRRSSDPATRHRSVP